MRYFVVIVLALLTPVMLWLGRTGYVNESAALTLAVAYLVLLGTVHKVRSGGGPVTLFPPEQEERVARWLDTGKNRAWVMAALFGFSPGAVLVAVVFLVAGLVCWTASIISPGEEDA